MSPPADVATGGAFDWAGAYHRLERLSQAVEPGARPPQERHRILDARAAELARPLTTPAAEESLDLVCFRCGVQAYGLSLEQVTAVVPCALLRVPGLGDLHLGVFNYRGTTVAAIDLALLLGQARTECADRISAVIVEADRRRLGLIADDLVGIVRCPTADIRPLQVAEDAHAHGAVVGVTGQGWLVLDAVYLLRDARLLVDEEVTVMGSKGKASV
jgi:purine-binding chemotaxis protein CheW